MRPALLVLGVAVLATGLFIAWRARADKVPAIATAEAGDANDSALAMKSAIASLRAEVGGLHRRTAEAPRPEPAPASPAAREVERSAAAAPQRSEVELFDGLAELTRHEGKDPASSRGAEVQFAGALRGEGMAGSSFVAADCRSTSCRVEVAHEDLGSQQELLRFAPRAAPFNQAAVAHREDNPDGKTSHTVLYVAREGHPLPRLDD